MHRLYIAIQKWKEKPGLRSFIGIYRAGFDKNCKWHAPRKMLRVISNLISGKYNKFCEDYSEFSMEAVIWERPE